MSTPLNLQFASPARDWTSALPLGDGRRGLMVHGGVTEEHLQINDGTAWSGSPASEHAGRLVDEADASDALAAARAAISAEDFDAAAEQLQRLQHRHSQSYVAFADVHVRFGGVGTVSDYRRRLDLRTAGHEVRFHADGWRIVRNTFVSRPHGVAVMTIHTENPQGLDLEVEFSTPLREIGRHLEADEGQLLIQLPSTVTPPVDAFPDPVSYSDDPDASMRAALVVAWTHDGVAGPRPLSARGVRSATLVLSTDTTFVGLAQWPQGTAEDAAQAATRRVHAALADGAAEVRAQQAADHTALFGTAELETGAGPSADKSLDVRLREANADPRGAIAHDPALAGLLYNFGRYLLVCSSRPGGLPANLQGIWNDLVQPPWSGNYTTNINVEMNYWPAEVANLGACAMPLFDLIDALTVTGQETARRLYNAPGWVAHHNTDPWAYTQPVGWGRHDPRWAFWPMAGAWLVRHLWEHVAFGAGPDFARQRAWGPIRSAAEFYLDWLVEMPDGSLGTSPSSSPENVFRTPTGAEGSVDVSSTLDLTLIRDLFRILGELAEMLGEQDDPVVELARAARPRIPGLRVGKDGLIPEWAADRPQVELAHRHLSHLFAMYPGDDMLDAATTRAVSASLDGRGDEATGWSLAWKVALRARLGQADRVSDLLRLVFRDMEVDRGAWIGGLYPNLFVAHPPFQIDGNFGYVAALTECLVQSHTGAIQLLPAVPPELSAGRLRGALARPGIEIDLTWLVDENEVASPSKVTLRAVREGADGPREVTWAGRSAHVVLEPGIPITLTDADFPEIR